MGNCVGYRKKLTINKELKRATGNFDPRGLIGEGEFTKVFKGWVDEKTLKPVMFGSGLPVAVKRCQLQNMQAFQKWLSEVNILGSLSHPNVVKLLGYCWNDRELLLVYEFMALGNLETCLFGKGAALKPLSWSTRLNIAIRAARALAFIHTSENQVIYRDIKTSNILLGPGYTAKLSDFGLARNGPSDVTHVTTQLKGDFAYAAPEYVATGHLYVKSDVYGFGVVLLEMLLGRRAYDKNRPSGEQYLVEWAKPILADNKKLIRVMDPRLNGQYSSKGAFRLGQLILWCLTHDRKRRPSMEVVVHTLELIEAINMVKGTSRNSSVQLSSATTSVETAKVAVPLPLPPNI